MQIVIDISEVTYLDVKYHSASLWSWLTDDEVQKAIRKGVVLPYEHGRLIDADDLYREYREIAIEPYINAPTIIEATESEPQESEGKE